MVDYQSTRFRLAKNKFRDGGLSFFVQNKNVTDNLIRLGSIDDAEWYVQKPLELTYLNVSEDQGKVMEIASLR